MDLPVIEVKNLHKSFVLPTEKVGSIKSSFTSLSLFKKKKYGTQKAISGISFNVYKGEFLGIVGRNGSGKSTLLKILAGIYQPTKGSITTTGKVVPFIELGVGFNPELTGKDNTYLNGAMLGFSHKEIDKKYKSIVEFAELEKFMDQKLKNYSSGMQVRLAFSVATILADSDILLLDEVLAVGDAEFQRKCFNYFKTLKKNKKTVIFVSHDMNAVKEYCDRAILIENGKIKKQGTAVAVSREYAKLFIPQDERNRGRGGMRWGNKDIVFKNIQVYPKNIENQDIIISAELVFNKTIDNPIIGFSIKSASDQQITGTNTKIANSNLGIIEKGGHLRIEWKVQNVLNDGTYYVNVAAETQSQDACDWWEEAASFDVYKNTATGFAIQLPIETHVKN
jgi:ABC-2 type transport system ATP-binding protein